MLGDVPSAHPSPVLFLSNIHLQPISKIPNLTSSEMKYVTLHALTKKGREVPNAQVEIPDILPQLLVHFFIGPIFPEHKAF